MCVNLVRRVRIEFRYVLKLVLVALNTLLSSSVEGSSTVIEDA